LYLAGQKKGLAIKDMLQQSHQTFTNIVFVDDTLKNVTEFKQAFENTPYLDYVATEFIIPAEQLLPENAYQLSVEHAILDTTITEGVPGFATFATTTFLDIMTLGSATGEAACPEILKNFDAGQTNLRQPR
jgi:hypothetical protein